MFRLFVSLHLLFAALFACEGSYNICMQKAKDTEAIEKNHLSIPLANNRHLIYSSSPPNLKILKHDPFLGLYLVEKSTKFPHIFSVGVPLALGLGVVDRQRAQEGMTLSSQIGLNTLAQFDQSYKAPALITNSCCALEGIATKNGIIQKEYIKHFISREPLEYGDIGVRTEDRDAQVVVSASDPFMSDNPFKKGDIIVAFNGKKIDSASLFMQKVLFSKIGSKAKVALKREGQRVEVEIVVRRRYGGGEISDTFLESRGIYFEKDMKISRLSVAFREYGLLLGDRLIQVNGVEISTQEDLRRYIEDFRDYSSLLFERNKFHFFVNIK